VQHVVLDEGSANVLNALNNRLAAIGALADLLHGSPLDPERARALMMLHGEVRRAAEITQHFLELAQHPIGAAEPSDCSIVLNGVLAEREGTLRELGVKLVRSIPTSSHGRLPHGAAHRDADEALGLRAAPAARQPATARAARCGERGRALAHDLSMGLRHSALGRGGAAAGDAIPLHAKRGRREIEFALARALAQSSGGTLRLRPRPGGGAEVVVTLPKSVLAPLARATAATPSLPKLRILVVDDDAVNRQAMRLLLEREGHEVVASKTASKQSSGLGPRATASTRW